MPEKGRWGVPALAGAVVPLDAPVVQRMRAAGAIPIARTNLPDMALRVSTDSSLHGITRNPWNLMRTAGGSSGGEAAALATGMSPIGLGNDIGGSLRNPASACGIATIRPSAGRVPDAGFVPAEDHLLAVQLMNVQGPMARRIADVRLGLQVLMGAHPRDPWSITAPLVGPAVGKAFLQNANSAVAPLASVAEMSQLLALRDGLGRAWSQFMAEHPLVLTPTWTQLPFEQGFDAATPAGTAATVEMMRPVVPANLLGLPSACVPAGRDSATGLPIGVLLTGARMREDMCLDAAERVEAQCGLATPIDPVA